MDLPVFRAQEPYPSPFKDRKAILDPKSFNAADPEEGTEKTIEGLDVVVVVNNTCSKQLH